MDLVTYLRVVGEGLTRAEGFLPVPLPGPLAPEVVGHYGKGDWRLVLIAADGLPPERLALLCRLFTGLPTLAAFVYEGGATSQQVAALTATQNERWFPCVVDLPSGLVSRPRGAPSLGLRSLDVWGARGPAAAGGLARPWLTWALLGLLAVIFLVTQMQGLTPENMIRWGALDRGALWSGQSWRLFTAMFLHWNAPHLLMNGLALYNLGSAIEALFGRGRMLFIYLVGGLAGSLLSVWLGSPFGLGAGASGAIFALFGAFIYFGLFPRPGMGVRWRPVLVTLALNGLYGLLNPGIDNWAHLGGLLGGLLAAAAVDLPERRPGLWRKALAAALAGLGVAAVVGLVPLGGQWYLEQQAGVAAAEAGDLATALDHLEKAVELRPDDPINRYYLGQLYYLSGRTQEAVGQLEEALRLAPQFTEAKVYLERIRGQE